MKILAIGDFHGKFPEKLKHKIQKIIREGNVDLILGLGDYTGLPAWRPVVMKQLRAGKKGNEIPSWEDLLGKKKFDALLKRDFNAGLNVLKKVNLLGKPCIMIFGNGDWYRDYHNKGMKTYEKYVKRMKNLKNITYSRTKFMKMNFIGAGGYMDIDSFFNKKEWNLEDAENLRNRFERRKQSKKILFRNLSKAKGEKILVLHYTPRGIFDIIHSKGNPLNRKSAGVSIFNEAIKKYNPKIVFCGHMHEYQGKKRLGKSLVINPGNAEGGRFAIVDIQEKDIKIKFVR